MSDLAKLAEELNQSLAAIKQDRGQWARDWRVADCRSIVKWVDDNRDAILAALRDAERLNYLDSQRKWGDGFAVQNLDSGDAYVRPWRYSSENDERFKHIKAYTDVRAAIDAAMRKEGEHE